MTDPEKKYTVKTGNHAFEFSSEEIMTADIVKKSPVQFSMIQNSQSVNATILHCDENGKKIEVEVDGQIFTVEISDPLDRMLKEMGFSEISEKQMKELKAPMPGLVLEINVSEGQEVQEGDKILILGAMKMENSIIVQHSAKIRKINVSKGEAVEKGHILVEFE